MKTVIPTQMASEPEDSEILSWNNKRLKEFAKTKYTLKPNEPLSKQRLLFMALDCKSSGWTKQRLNTLIPKCRSCFIEYKIRPNVKEFDETKIEIYINPKPEQTKQREEIIDEFLEILNKSKPENQALVLSKSEPQKTSLNNNDDNDINDDDDDDISSVSTHDSMPSLMSDDDSDQDDISDGDLSDDSDGIDLENDIKSNDEHLNNDKKMKQKEPVKNKKNKTKSTKSAKSGISAGFLVKPKKNKKGKNQQNKKKKTPKPSPKPTPKQSPKPKQKVNDGNNNNKNNKKNNKKNNDSKPKKEKKKEIEKMKDSEEEKPKILGFKLQPEIDAKKDALGDMFICIGARKEAANLNEYRYLKCYVSLKQKLKKKGKKKPIHDAVLIDLRNTTKFELRDLERQKLKIGYENVLSFQCNPNHSIADIKEDNEERLGLNEAFNQYQKMHLLPKQEDNNNDNKNKKNDNEQLMDDKNNKSNKKKSQQWSPSKSISNKSSPSTKSTASNHDEQKEENQEEHKEEDKEQNKRETDEVTLELLNSCRFNKNDLLAIMDDPDIDEIVNGLYIGIFFEKKKPRIYRIEKTMDYPISYTFMNEKITKGLQVSYGSKITNKKFIKVSNLDFGAKELYLWKQKMLNDNVSLPDKSRLNEIAERIILIRKTAENLQNAQKTQKTPPPPPPGMVPPGMMPPVSPQNNNNGTFASLNAQNLQELDAENPISIQDEYLNSYISAIAAGYKCFYCIPTSKSDTEYVCILLAKQKANEPILREALDLARDIIFKYGGIRDIEYTEIREWIVEQDETKWHNAKDGYWRSKGYLINCKHSKIAYQLHQELQLFIYKKVENKNKNKKHCTNFSRLVLKEFGDAFMDKSIPIRVKKKFKPHGPRYPYKDGEPSIYSMALDENQNKVTYGEWDHGTIDNRSIASHLTNVSIKSSITNKTNTKYSHLSHMTAPQQQHYGYNQHQYQYRNQPGYQSPNNQNNKKKRKNKKK